LASIIGEGECVIDRTSTAADILVVLTLEAAADFFEEEDLLLLMLMFLLLLLVLLVLLLVGDDDEGISELKDFNEICGATTILTVGALKDDLNEVVETEEQDLELDGDVEERISLT